MTRSCWLIRYASSSGRAEPVDISAVVGLDAAATAWPTPLIRSTTTTVFIAASTAVPHTSPSPCRQCPSPRANSAPGTLTPKYAVDPGPQLRGVHVAAVRVGGDASSGASNAAGRDADRAVHRVQRQLHAVVRRAGPGTAHRARGDVDVVDARPRSSSGGCSIAVVCVPVSAPKCGNVAETAQSRAGAIVDEVHARGCRPGSAPSTWNGPVTGLRYGNSHTWRGQVVDAADPAAEAVLGVQLQRPCPAAPAAPARAPPKVYAQLVRRRAVAEHVGHRVSSPAASLEPGQVRPAAGGVAARPARSRPMPSQMKPSVWAATLALITT